MADAWAGGGAGQQERADLTHLIWLIRSATDSSLRHTHQPGIRPIGVIVAVFAIGFEHDQP